MNAFARRAFNCNHFMVLSMTRPLVVAILTTGYAVFSHVGAAGAADKLGYSFEAGLDGFAANGGGVTVTQDTIGATQGTQSMKVAVVAGATFVGAATGTLDTTTLGNTAIVGDPPGLDHVTFDLTVPQRFGARINPLAPDPFNGFVSIGVTVFGKNQAGDLRDTQIDYTTRELRVGSLAPGTYRDLRIELDAMVHGETFAILPFNDVFGTQGSGPNDLIPTGWQLYFNKSGNSSDYDHSLTLYIDNVRFGTSVPGDYNGNGTVDAADYVLWRKGGPLIQQTEVADPGTVSPADYTEWRARFGNSPAGSGSGLANGSVPEPGSACLVLIAAGASWLARIRRAVVQ
jgi:hypothetical protein